MQSVLPFEKSISNGAQNNFFILFPDILPNQAHKSSSGLGFKHYIQLDFQTSHRLVLEARSGRALGIINMI